MDTRYKKNELMEWLSKLEEPTILYEIAKLKEESEKGINFDKEFENGYTLEEAKAESIKKIREWWGK